MLSIDFGNTYTKVALRLSSEERSSLIKDDSLKWDEFNICIPSVAASYGSGTNCEWYFGTDVLKFKESTDGLKIYRNWKPRFFEPTPATKKATKKKRALVGTTADLRTRPTPVGFTDPAWEATKKAVSDQELKKILIGLGIDIEANEQEGTSAEQTAPIFKDIGLGYFKWLKTFIDPFCKKFAKLPLSKVPARISLPGFGSITSASMLLQEILSEAGWNLDKQAPVLAEPLSNAIGTFTAGRNATNLNGKAPHYGNMFAEAGMLEQMRSAALFGGPKTSWVLIVDLGGYTADFAMVGLELEEIDARLTGELDGKKRLAYDSQSIGVTDLDLRVLEVLSEEKQQVMKEAMDDPDQQRLESLHRNLFGPVGRYALKKRVIGGTAEEKRIVTGIIEDFSQEVAEASEKFLDIHQYEKIDELILTGGGTMIPSVRNAIASRLSHYGVKKLHVCDQGYEQMSSSISTHKMPASLVRGATSLGGSSVYFDFADDQISQ